MQNDKHSNNDYVIVVNDTDIQQPPSDLEDIHKMMGFKLSPCPNGQACPKAPSNIKKKGVRIVKPTDF